jgi:N-acetylglucosaminyl-diphospho-decaprenol L-rhamnosyltransferase
MARDITLSVVSHQQNALINELLPDLERHCASSLELVITQNVPDSVPLSTGGLSMPIRVLSNEHRKGFGANHNAAFKSCTTRYFCVINPDVRLGGNPFPMLIESLGGSGAGVAGPLVRSPGGKVENSARRFPSALSLALKVFGAGRGPEYPVDRGALDVDWIAGMFMLFRADAFRAVGGFDERYFLYYEDVDICRRLGRRGLRVRYDPRAEIAHDARRTSWRNPRYLRWHVSSVLRFLLSG